MSLMTGEKFSPCLIIPCYNHGATMTDVVSRLKPFGLPCIVVDDGSDSATAQELDRLAATTPWLTLHRMACNQGKGAAVMAALKLASVRGFSHALQVDADGQHHLADVPLLLAEAQQHPDCLISGRPVYDHSVPKARLYGRYITHVWVWIETLSLSLKDSMCGFRVYPLVPTLRLMSERTLGERMDFDIEIMVRLYWQGTRSRFIPTPVIYPPDGLSHFDALKDNLRISLMHSRLFFGMLPRIPQLLRQRSASAESHWSVTQERKGLWGIRLMLCVYHLLGRRAFELLLYPVIGYFWLTGHVQRRASQLYLRRLDDFARRKNVSLPYRLNTFRHFMRFGGAMLNKLASWQGKLQNVTLMDEALCEAQIACGRGTLILASHLGDIESCRAIASLNQRVVVNALVFTQHAERFNQVMKEVNPQANINLIQVSDMGPETAILLKEKLDAGEWVAMVGDRTSAGRHQRGEQQARVIYSPFLGHPAPFPQGPFILAAALGAPVFLMFGIECAGRLNIHFEPFADPLLLPRNTRHEALQQAVDHYAGRLEHYCLRAPHDWFNFFDFWQSSPDPCDNRKTD